MDFAQRVREIIDEKKNDGGNDDEKIIKAIASGIGKSPRTVYRVLAGQRYAKLSEQKVFATVLGVPIERLLQTDVRNIHDEIDMMMDEKKADLEAAYLKALEYNRIAIGISERYDAARLVGKVLYNSRKWEEAGHWWLDAYVLAQQIGEPSKIYEACKSVLIISLRRKRHTHVERILSEIGGFLNDDHVKLGEIYFFCGAIEYNLKNYDEALLCFEKSLRENQLTNDEYLIGKALHNVASCHLKQNNLLVAKAMYEQAMDNLKNANAITRLTTVDEYVETLEKLHQHDKALALINDSIQSLKDMVQPGHRNLLAKFLLHKSLILKNNSWAEEALELIEADTAVRIRIMRYLLDFYLRGGDAVKALYYHENISALEPGV